MSSNEVKIYTPNFENKSIDDLIQYVKDQNKLKKMIQINLDNCTIQRMEKLTESSTIDDLKKVGLFDLYKLLNECNNIALTALGIIEMPGCYTQKASSAYELFCKKFWKGAIDDPKGTYPLPKEERHIDFSKLPREKQQNFGIYYISYLLIQKIYKIDKDKSAIDKFKTYVYGIICYLDMISAFELEIAKYAFWELNEKELRSLPEQIQNIRQNIKNNFFKAQKSLEKIQRFCLNATMDAFWIRSIGFGTERQEQIENGYTISEHWLATNDDKLFCIANLIKPVPDSNGQFGFYVETMREEELSQYNYWKEVDRFADEILLTRKQSISKFNESKFNEKIEKIPELIASIELELKEYFNK